ncbi:MAG: DUF1674 domain-containing protein [Xanthomonadaceae bacterium]|nr:DUF1674 domain-containing protein [Xanthomonadaceae bacterium]
MDEQHKPIENETEVSRSDTTKAKQQPTLPKEIGGRDGPEPTRFGDWEKDGRCIDF